NDGKTFHGIRRLLGTTMVSEGTPVTTVAQILGHQAISSTRQYIAMDLNGLQKCALPLSSIGGEV
ncbi:tyrosine-type recombinase/integrase, partial [Clostridium fessum]|uniref:tyrosine-type recombinase/integrase n=2 Tax=Clostridiaceae TaxID=31979 RepID=UPI003AAC10A0